MRIWMALLFFHLALGPAFGEDENPEQTPVRPKIAIVLSGGGARGFAHVGVLRWLEEHHIPVDMISGTSMGGLIGGMYATGMTPDALQEMVSHIDWADLFRPVPAYSTLNFRRKEDRRAFPNHLELGLKKGIKFPPGVNSGHAIGLLLDRYTLAYSEVQDFDELPIRFRCLATDMVNAEQVVLGHGSLPTALQATMAIPGVFYPVEIEGRILASDGGLLNNVPTDVAEQMGADVIIAVNIGTPLAKREALDSLGGMLGQTISVTMEQNIRKNLDQQQHPRLKVIIAPDLKKYTTFSFADFEEITNLGYQEAGKMSEQLLPYSLGEQEWRQYVDDRSSRVRRRQDLPIPQAIQVQGTREGMQKMIKDSMKKHLGRGIEPRPIERDLTTLWGSGRFAGLSYQLAPATQPPELLIQVREKTYAPPFLNVGLEINNTQTDVFDFNLRARVTLMDRLREGTEWRFDGSLGSEISIGTEYYKQLGATRFFVAPRASYERTKSGVFRDEAQIGEYQLTTGDLGGDLGLAINSSAEFRIGYDFGRGEGKVRIGDPQLPEGSGKFSKASLRLAIDSTDSPVLPLRGARISSGVTWNFDVPLAETANSDHEFPQAYARATVFKTFAKRNTIFLAGEADTSFDYNASPLEKFRMGGFLRISAASRNEFVGNHALYGGIGLLRKIADLPFLVGDKLSAGIWYEAGSAYDKWDEADIHQSVSTGVLAETFLGPLFVGVSFGDGGRNNFFVAIGKAF